MALQLNRRCILWHPASLLQQQHNRNLRLRYYDVGWSAAAAPNYQQASTARSDLSPLPLNVGCLYTRRVHGVGSSDYLLLFWRSWSGGGTESSVLVRSYVIQRSTSTDVQTPAACSIGVYIHLHLLYRQRHHQGL